MSVLRKGLPLVAGAALLLSAGTASAQINLNNWILDLTQAGLPGQRTTGEPIHDPIGIDAATFVAPTRVVSQDNDNNGFLSPGDTQTAVGIGSITSFVNANGQVFQNATDGVTNTSLGLDFEVTFAFTLNEVITDRDGDDIDFAHTGGTLDLYVDTDPTTRFNGNAGTGATDGDLIASFEVVAGAGGGNIDLSDLDGNVNVVFRATDIAEGWLFDTDGTDISTLLDPEGDPLLIAFSDSNFDICVPGDPDCEPSQFIEGGAFDALGTPYPTEFNEFDFFADEDGSINLAVLPEPGTLAVFGLGLLGLGIAVRRRQRTRA